MALGTTVFGHKKEMLILSITIHSPIEAHV